MFVKNEAAMKVGNYLIVADVHVGVVVVLPVIVDGDVHRALVEP